MKVWDKRLGRAEYVGLFIIFAFFLVLNFMTPMLADDYIFSINRATWMPLTHFGEIFESLRELRGSVSGNGRVVAHFFAQLFLLWPKWIFNIVNALNATFIFFLIYRLVKRGEGGQDAVSLFLAFSLVWLIVPAWGQVFVWLTGACNYSGTITFSLLFLTPFIAAHLQDDSKLLISCESPWAKMLHLLVSFTAGAYSENGAFSMLGIAFLLMLIFWFRNKKLPDKFLLLSFAAACAGFLFLMLCPAELLGRTGSAGESTFVENLKLLFNRILPRLGGGKAAAAALVCAAVFGLGIYGGKKNRRVLWAVLTVVPALIFVAAAVVFRPERQGAGFFGYMMTFLSDTKESVLIMFFLSYFLVVYVGHKKQSDKKLLSLSVVLLIGAAASILIFVVAAYFPPRSAAYAGMYTVLVDLFMLREIYDKGGIRFFRGFVCAAALIFALSLAPAVKDISSSTALGRQRELLLEQASESGPRTVYLEAIVPESKYSPFWPGDADYYNGDICIFYNLDWVEMSDYALRDDEA